MLWKLKIVKPIPDLLIGVHVDLKFKILIVYVTSMIYGAINSTLNQTPKPTGLGGGGQRGGEYIRNPNYCAF